MSKEVDQRPMSTTVLMQEGPNDSLKCAKVLWAITQDVGLKRVTPQMSNAMCNAIGKLLKLHEMQIKFGVAEENGGTKRLKLTE